MISTFHLVVLLDRDGDGVLRRNGENSYASAENAVEGAPSDMVGHAGAIVLSMVRASEGDELGDVKVHAVLGEWDMGALIRDPLDD